MKFLVKPFLLLNILINIILSSKTTIGFMTTTKAKDKNTNNQFGLNETNTTPTINILFKEFVKYFHSQELNKIQQFFVNPLIQSKTLQNKPPSSPDPKPQIVNSSKIGSNHSKHN